MKTLNYCILFLSFLFVSCEGPAGPDGEDGDAYLRVRSSYGELYSYNDNNSGIPYGFSESSYYYTDPGTYSFSYESRLYSSSTSYTYTVWSGTYRITVNPGSKGGEGKPFWQEGEKGVDGFDKYLTLYCNYNGASLSKVSPTNEQTENISQQNPQKIREEKNGLIFEVEYWKVTENNLQSISNNKKSGLPIE